MPQVFLAYPFGAVQNEIIASVTTATVTQSTSVESCRISRMEWAGQGLHSGGADLEHDHGDVVELRGAVAPFFQAAEDFVFGDHGRQVALGLHQTQ
jgi:hypothetical protein